MSSDLADICESQGQDTSRSGAQCPARCHIRTFQTAPHTLRPTQTPLRQCEHPAFEHLLRPAEGQACPRGPLLRPTALVSDGIEHARVANEVLVRYNNLPLVGVGRRFDDGVGHVRRYAVQVRGVQAGREDEKGSRHNEEVGERDGGYGTASAVCQILRWRGDHGWRRGGGGQVVMYIEDGMGAE